MRRLCCLLFAVLIAAPEAASAPAPFQRPARKAEKDPLAEVNKQFAARGVKDWWFGHVKGHHTPFLQYEWPLPKGGTVIGRIAVVDNDRLRAIREALAELDAIRELGVL